MSTPLKIYIAGPYSAATDAEVCANIERAIDAGLTCLQKGHWPYIPHLSALMDRRATDRGLTITYDEWLAFDAVWLTHCDALLYLAPSPGATRERDQAVTLGLQIFTTLDGVPVTNTEGETGCPE